MLTQLYLSSNKLEDDAIDAAFDDGGAIASAPPFPHLATLCLYGNRLRSLPRVLKRLRQLPKLAELDLAGNPCCGELESSSSDDDAVSSGPSKQSSRISTTPGGGTHRRFSDRRGGGEADVANGVDEDEDEAPAARAVRLEFARERRLNPANFYRHSAVRAISRLKLLDGDAIASIDKELANMWCSNVRQRALAEASPTVGGGDGAGVKGRSRAARPGSKSAALAANVGSSVRNKASGPRADGPTLAPQYCDASLAHNPLLLEYRAQAAASVPFGDRYESARGAGGDAGARGASAGAKAPLSDEDDSDDVYGVGASGSPYFERGGGAAKERRRRKKQEEMRAKKARDDADASEAAAAVPAKRSAKRSFVGRIRAYAAAVEVPPKASVPVGATPRSDVPSVHGIRKGSMSRFMKQHGRSSKRGGSAQTSAREGRGVEGPVTERLNRSAFDESIEIDSDSESDAGSDDGVVKRSASRHAAAASGVGGSSGALSAAAARRLLAEARSTPHEMIENLLATVELLQIERGELLAQIGEAEAGGGSGWSGGSGHTSPSGGVSGDDGAARWLSRGALVAENTMLRHENANMFAVQVRRCEWRAALRAASSPHRVPENVHTRLHSHSFSTSRARLGHIRVHNVPTRTSRSLSNSCSPHTPSLPLFSRHLPASEQRARGRAQVTVTTTRGREGATGFRWISRLDALRIVESRREPGQAASGQSRQRAKSRREPWRQRRWWQPRQRGQRWTRRDAPLFQPLLQY
jgi:hypothetical protein